MSAGYLVVWLLAIYAVGALLAPAGAAARNRDWKAFWAYIIMVASVVAVGAVALAFNT